jgi:hypothetical protein
MRRLLPALLLATTSGLAADAGRAEPAEVASIGPTDATFAWRTDEPEATRLRLRAAGDAAEWRTVEAATGPARYHVLDVDGLTTGTSYEYRLGDGDDGPHGTLTTRTPPPGERIGVLWVLADIHLCVSEVQPCPNGLRRLGAANGTFAAALDEVRERAAALPDSLPQAILILGDLAQHPVPETWRLVAAADTGDLPLCLIPGNHDAWDETWTTRWAETTAALDDPACRYDGLRGELRLGPWRIVLLSSVVAGENHGELGEEQRTWLDERLAAEPDAPTLLALHHPWVPHPLSPLLGEAATYTQIHDAAALETLLARHPQVHGALSGHLHVNWTGVRGTVTQHVFSSSAQFPIGYHSLTLHEDGLIRRFHPLRTAGEESAASAEALRRWAADRGIPLAGAVTGVVAGDTASRSGVQRLPAQPAPAAPEHDATATPAPPADTAAPEANAGPDATAEARAAGPAPTTAARPEDTRRTNSGCRCALATATRGEAAAAALGLLAVLLGRRRRAAARRAQPER